MGKAKKELEAFIEDIPDGKLTGFRTTIGPIYKDTNFRLDMQGMTSDQPPKHNLQVQVNHETTISTLKAEAGKTVAGPVLVDSENPNTAQEIRDELTQKMKF